MNLDCYEFYLWSVGELELSPEQETEAQAYLKEIINEGEVYE